MQTERQVERERLQKPLSPSDYGCAGFRSSLGIQSASQKMRNEKKPLPYIGVFPTDIWSRILPQVHPFQLIRISRSSRDLHNMIHSDDSILRRSRMKFMPNIPMPVLDITECKLFNLIYGFGGCQKCPFETATTCWAFRARLCHSCMMEHSEKVNFM